MKQTKAERPMPPGKKKIMAALKKLLEEKEFNAITTAEIARTAGVTEALIYKYFKDKRDLLHEVINDYMIPFLKESKIEIKKEKGALNKLKKMIWCHLHAYRKERVFGKILILDSRSSQEYFTSKTYEFAQEYAGEMLTLIKEGMAEGVLRDDLNPAFIRQVIIGGIEYLSITNLALNKPFSPEAITDDLFKLLIEGIGK